MRTEVLLPTARHLRLEFWSIACALVAVTAVAIVTFSVFPVWSAVALSVWSVPVVWAGVVDLRTGRLPDAIVLPGLIVTLVLTAIARDVGGALAGSLLLCLPMLLVHLARPDGLGFGDVKFAALLGAGLGIVVVPLVLPAFLLAAFVHTIGCALERAHGRLVPFGPALAAGSIVAVLLVTPRVV
jgi:leader peptidase (prepilin peptidase)/N-methyltransferase